MFTGIVEEIGSVAFLHPSGGGVRIGITAPASCRELRINDSVSVNGVCLTVVSSTKEVFEALAVEETLKKTSLGGLRPGSKVNLELPLRFNDRLGGHLMLGHIDTTGTITDIEERDTSRMFTISIPEQFRKYTVPVGSIGVDGVSLTIAEVTDNAIRVSIIPHTLEKTLFQTYRLNDRVNLEFDVIGKYIERLMTRQDHTGSVQKTGLEEQKLRESGF